MDRRFFLGVIPAAALPLASRAQISKKENIHTLNQQILEAVDHLCDVLMEDDETLNRAAVRVVDIANRKRLLIIAETEAQSNG